MERNKFATKATIVVTGATGLIGRAFSQEMISAGASVCALARDCRAAADRLPGLAGSAAFDLGQPLGTEALNLIGKADAVVHLAGGSIFRPFRGARTLRRLVEERIRATRALVDAFGSTPSPPQVFVFASSVGAYGFDPKNDGDLTELSHPPLDTMGEGSLQMEETALRAESFGVRTIALRLGYVLAAGGGGFPYQLKAARGGTVPVHGNGRQWSPWIHIDDVVGILQDAIQNPALRGAVNAVAPDLRRADDFARILADTTGATRLRHVPQLATRLFMGPGAPALLHGRRIVPVILQKAGYRFRFPDLGTAIRNLVFADEAAMAR